MAYKTGSVRYYVTTDTHGYPWGFRNGVNGKTIHFDLGDNTIAQSTTDLDPVEQMSTACNIALRGNHDMALNPDAKLEIQEYRDLANKIIVFGLDSSIGLGDNVGELVVPLSQIDELGKRMLALDPNWDIIILTHIPLMLGNKEIIGKPWGGQPDNREKVLMLLHGYQNHISVNVNDIDYDFSKKTGFVIGCFAGHIHAHVKVVYTESLEDGRGRKLDVKIPMEIFSSNGADEWLYSGNYFNAGVYDPYECYINVTYDDTNTMNGMHFVNVNPADQPLKLYSNYHDAANCIYLNKASGQFKMIATGSAYPKFYNGVYLGYTNSPLTGTALNSNSNIKMRTWTLTTAVNFTLANVGTKSCRYIRFDTNGRLRQASTASTGPFYEIQNYKTTKITFVSNNITWTFQNGLLQSAVPLYASGTILGKNQYAIVFNSSGNPSGITNKGVLTPYPAGQNYINVYTQIDMYQNATYKKLTNIPQIGITGEFTSTSVINLVREDSIGTNQGANPTGTLMKVIDANGANFWLYNGKLTKIDR